MISFYIVPTSLTATAHRLPDPFEFDIKPRSGKILRVVKEMTDDGSD